MSEHYRENRPLLCDGYSDDENRSMDVYHKRFKGRARNTVKGVASIIIKWPDYWTSTLVLWWLAFGMIALTIFVIYNCMATFSILPSVHTKQTKPRVSQDNVQIIRKTFPGVVMHLLYEENEILDINKYISSIEKLAETNAEFDYSLVLILNDTSQVKLNHIKGNNEIALDSLWTEKKLLGPTIQNVKVRHTTLSTFMNNSPLKTNWEGIPKQYIAFLIKAIEVWQNGGIAIDPLVLFQHTPQFEIKKKFLELLVKYRRHEQNTKLIPGEKSLPKPRKKVNNIRDIIDALESDHVFQNLYQGNLTEAEDFDHLTIVTRPSTTFPKKHKFEIITGSVDSKNNDGSQLILDPQRSSRQLQNDDGSKIGTVTKGHTRSGSDILQSNASFPKNFRRRRNAAAYSFSTSAPLGGNEPSTKFQMQPMVTSDVGLKLNKSKNLSDVLTSYNEDDGTRIKKLTLDLKGTMIATQTACHSFIGTLFSNVRNHTETSVSNLIIAELSVFCKGLLSTCKGVDVIFN